MIIYYNVPETWCITDIIVVFDFGQFFALIAQKLKIKGNQTMKFGQLIEKYCEENEAGKLVPDYFSFFKKPFY